MQDGTRLKILESMMRAVKVGALMLDHEQRIVLWNDWIEQHAQRQVDWSCGLAFVDAFPQMTNGRTHAAIREALENNFPSVISQTLNKAPFLFYCTGTDLALDNRIQQAVEVIPIAVPGQQWHCLIQIIDVSKAVMREKLLREQTVALRNLSFTDATTGIANRRHFDVRLEEETARARRTAAPVSVLMIDIDHFKAYNDSYGHQQGDKCLRAVAQELIAVLQRPADLMTRYGGEEFAAILPDTDTDGALHLAEAMRHAIEHSNLAHRAAPGTPRVTVSIGVGTHQSKQAEQLLADRLVACADSGLYMAKNDGRNCVRTGQFNSKN